MHARHRLFAAEYIRNGKIGVQAVYAAGYSQGYNAACVTASRLLRNAKVKSLIDEIVETAVVDAELTAERVSKEIAKLAYVPVKEINSSDKLKALDLATKVLGMQSTKLETVDLTEKSATESSLLKSIESAANRDNCTSESAAIQLFQALSDDPQLSQVEAWPPQYREIIRQSLTSQQVTEIQGEQ